MSKASPPWWEDLSAKPVRCCDCKHWSGRHGWCEVAHRNAFSARMMRICDFFKRRFTDYPPPGHPVRIPLGVFIMPGNETRH